MARKTRVRRSSIFLLELIIAILFFSVLSAVCTQVFVKARDLSQEAQLLSEAVCICSNSAELVRSAETPEEADQLLMEESNFIPENSRKLMVAYVENGVLQVKKSEEGGLHIYDFQFLKKDGSVLYELKLKRFFKGAGLL